MRDGVKVGLIIWAIVIAIAGAGLAYLVFENATGTSRGLYTCLVAGATAVVSGILVILSFADWWLRH